MWLFYVVRYGDTWSDSVIKYKVSSDRGRRSGPTRTC